MSTKRGYVTGLAHIGYGDENSYELLGYYSTVFGSGNIMSQDIRHPYIGKINGVTGCPYVIGFTRIESDATRLEFVGCINAVEGHAIYPFGVGGHMHLIYTTGDSNACYKRMLEHHVEIVSEIKLVDYGRFSGARSFFVRDLNGVYIQIVEDKTISSDEGCFANLVGVSYTVSDYESCIKNFSEALMVKCEEISVNESAFMRDLCVEKAPACACTVKLSEAENFAVEILKAQKPNQDADKIWVNSLGALHLCVMVDDIQAVYERMLSFGAVFVGPPSPVELGINKGAKAIFTKVSSEILLELFQGKPTAV